MRSLLLPAHQAWLRYHDLPGQPTVTTVPTGGPGAARVTTDGPGAADPAGGTAPVGVYLPGLASAGSADFPETAAQPGLRDRRWIVVDLLGAGFSDRPVRFGYTVEEHAETVAYLLDHLRLSGCTVVASSMGGAVAIVLAVRRPDLVGRLVVAEPAINPTGRGVLSPYVADLTEDEFVDRGHRALVEMLEQMSLTEGATAGTFAAAVRNAAPYALHRSARSLRTVREPGLREQLYALDLPRALIVGARSRVDVGGFTAHGIPTFAVPDAGHSMMDDNPVGFAEAIAAACAVPATAPA
ncbi:alpha/beta fold hydrolase [Micromonospora echinofusca]|uniref:Alpha/beta fold hydrolase n=1 Tax=Micromonospora echinofusca TaxID=47858 RepID=A0ABS3VKF4_MICEH|nr:alpha/beta hydrolase [Micromonospora echinofusca]MBO4205013.1 alpha/beta fold hydrolase [Micromonospora echinofusca]